ncbi:NAD(P)-dependent oxidoreductase [Bdellovibrionota bacterium FG-1]
MKRVFVTGGTGFIGQHAVQRLSQLGFDVHVYTFDLFDSLKLREVLNEVRPSHLLHLAWNTTHGQFWTTPENLRWVRCSLDLLEAFAEAGGKRVVMAGTCAEYDWAKAGRCQEDVTPCAPLTLYGAAKDSLRRILLAYSAQMGMSAAWGRVFLLYGPNENPLRLFPSIMLKLAANQKASVLHGSLIRDFLHVADVGSAFAHLLESPAQGAFNISSGVGVSLEDVARLIAKTMDKEDLLHVEHRPPNDANPPLLTGDNQKIMASTSWRPEISLEQGIRETIQGLTEKC